MNNEVNNTIFIGVAIAVLIGASAAVFVARRTSQTSTPNTIAKAVLVPTSIPIPTKSPIDQAQKQGIFKFSTPTPVPTFIRAAEPPPKTGICHEGGVNSEPEILVGYLPANGQSVGVNQQIRVWVNDEGAPFISNGEMVDSTTGEITKPGERDAKAPDGYLWEPALYIAPQTAETGGTPHFPTVIKGNYNNLPPQKKLSGLKGPTIDTPPAGTKLHEKYTAEFIWDVNSLGLTPGNYQAEFVIHDGDDDRGVGCINISFL